MKRILSLILIIAFVCSFCGCRKPSSSGSTPEPVTDTPVPEATAESGESEGLLSASYEMTMYGVYYDAPSSFAKYCVGATDLIYVEGVKLLTVSSNFLERVETLDEAFDEAMTALVYDTRDLQWTQSVETSFKEKVTVNGIETYHYEGQLTIGSTKVEQMMYVTGYAFIIDGVPCNIAGIVQDKSQSEELKTEIRNMVDAMMQSVRREP